MKRMWYSMTRIFIRVAAGERFAGGFLTPEGADQVNATRAAITEGHPARQTLGERLAKSLTSREFREFPRSRIQAQELIDSDKSIYPRLK